MERFDGAAGLWSGALRHTTAEYAMDPGSRKVVLVDLERSKVLKLVPILQEISPV
jgi:hypothetical protein